MRRRLPYRRRSSVLLLALCACGRVGFDSSADAGFDRFISAAAIPTPFGSTQLEGGSYVYDTDNGTLVEETSSAMIDHAQALDTSRDPPVRIASFLVLDVRAPINVIGSYPLAIVGDRITVESTIDLDANGSMPGPGAQPCNAMAGEADATGAGGGGGGAFAATGGRGGDGDLNDADLGIGGTGGTPLTAMGLRGGCNGANGGDAATEIGAAGGGGGGALLLQAETLTITGTLHAHGGGGNGGAFTDLGDAGGGGGGSGGMLVLVATTVTWTGGRLFANGGGGGEGAVNTATGQDGSDGIDADSPATGGDGGNGIANNGGDGGHGAMPAGRDVTMQAAGGGGGGGGSVGFVLLRANMVIGSASSSPAPVPL